MSFFLKFLPAETRALAELGRRIVSGLDTPEERKEAIRYGVEMLKDGKVSGPEWARFGKKLGILTGKH